MNEGKDGDVSGQQHAKTKGNQRGNEHGAHPSPSLWKYLLKRFPPALVGMLAISFGAGVVGLFASSGPAEPRTYLLIAAFATLYLALLLRYRVVDEWKDYRHDSRHYPDRPVQQGLVTVPMLIGLGIGAVLVEFTLAVVLGGVAGLPWYAIVTALTVGTAVDFAAKSFFERHFTLSFLVHQLVYIPMFVWAALALDASLAEPKTWYGIGSMTALFVSAELVRKFQPRTSAQGGQVADTYAVVWGRRLSLWGVLGLVVLAGWLAHLAVDSWFALGVSVVAALAIAARHRSDSWVMVGAGAHVPLLALAMVI